MFDDLRWIKFQVVRVLLAVSDLQDQLDQNPQSRLMFSCFQVLRSTTEPPPPPPLVLTQFHF